MKARPASGGESRGVGVGEHESWTGKLAAVLFLCIHRQQKGTTRGVNEY